MVVEGTKISIIMNETAKGIRYIRLRVLCPKKLVNRKRVLMQTKEITRDSIE
jgi:hypothetical protein